MIRKLTIMKIEKTKTRDDRREESKLRMLLTKIFFGKQGRNDQNYRCVQSVGQRTIQKKIMKRELGFKLEQGVKNDLMNQNENYKPQIKA